jgi:hypothetical protein
VGIRPSMTMVFGIDDLKFDTKNWVCTDERLIGYPKALPDGETECCLPYIEDKDRFDNSNMDLATIKIYLTKFQKDKIVTRDLFDVLFHYAEYGESNVIGFHPGESIYNSFPLWGLASLEDKYRQDGHDNLRSADPKDYYSLKFIYELLEESKDQKISIPLSFFRQYYKKNVGFNTIRRHEKNGWLYDYFDSYQIDAWAKVTQWLFKEIGLIVPDRDLKLMLCWRWS